MKPEDDMNIILVGKRHGKSRTVSINAPVLAGVVFIVTALLILAGWSGYQVAVSQIEPAEPAESELLAQWQSRLSEQKTELSRIERNVQQQVDALTLRLGDMQGRLLRLDALGQRFLESGLVASDEFDFDQPAAVGGPEESLDGDSFTAPELTSMIDQLARRIEDREQQLREREGK